MLNIFITFSERFIIQKYLYCGFIIRESPYLNIPLILQLDVRLKRPKAEYTFRDSFIHFYIHF